jgi:TolB-like protein/DNA-binding winged helix-turn-helix (wHTH) protein/thioredoxin-like negative regulator of GroEL
MTSQPVGLQDSISFGEGYELELRPRGLRRASRVLKLERIPLEILILLLEHPGETVTRADIVARIWGNDVFLDTDNSIRGAIRKIRHVLRDDPERPMFIQTVTGKGYRFIAPVLATPVLGNPPDIQAEVTNLETETALEHKSDPAPPVELATGTPHETPASHAQRIPHPLRWLAFTLAALIVLAAAYLVLKPRTTGATAQTIRSLAVLPLKNLSGDRAQDYLADGMTEELIGRLSAIRDLRVTSRTSVLRFKDPQLPISEIARTLGVDAIVEGSVMREGSRVRVHAQLIQAATDKHIWSESYDRELRSVFALESDVAQSIAARVKGTLSGEEHSQLVAARNVAPEVYESYLHGITMKRNNRTDVEESIRYFEQAIKADPTFAPAYMGLAGAYDTLGSVLVGAPPTEFRPKAIEAARKALDLDPELAEAHDVLADNYHKQLQWDDAENELKAVLTLRPNDASAHLGFAQTLLSRGRFDEALAWAKRGRELDPFAVSGTDIAWILYFARRYDEAERELRAELAVEPENSFALWYLGFVLIDEQKPADAIPVLEKALSVSHGSPGIKGVLIRAYAHAGRRNDALRLLDELKQTQRHGYVPAAAFIQAYVGLGDNDQAFFWLNRGYEERSPIMQWIKTEPTFDPIRSDPRYPDLLHRIGLDQEIHSPL